MNIEASKAGNSVASPLAMGVGSHGLDRQVQSVFSHVLEEAGRQGYASAQAVKADVPLEQELRNAWEDWAAGERVGGRYTSATTYGEIKQEFGELLVRAHDEGGYLDPQGFLGGLTNDELETLRQVHWLANPIQADNLTEEGALNLLLPPVAQVDLDNDGITRSGEAMGIRFPSSNTPPSVVAAWDTATEGMAPDDLMLYEMRMMLPLLTANFVVDDASRFVHRYEPGDPGFTNPMAREDYSYREAAQALLDALEFSKHDLPADQYLEQSAFWNRFGEELEARGAE